MRLIYLAVFSLFLAVFSFIPIYANAGVCQNKTQVVYSNGVFSTLKESQKSMEKLAQGLGVRVRFEPVALAYANDGGAALTLSGALPGMGQLLELYLQKKLVDNTNNFWNWLNGTGSVPAPQWFLDGMKRIAAGANAANYVLDRDVQNHVAIYTGYLNAGNKVVIVSHSQGNFYSNVAHRSLTAAGFGNNVGVVAVATPAGVVEGGGVHITAPEDWIIKGVRILSLGLGVLPANIGNTTTPQRADPFNHNFINFYMRGLETRYFIIQGIMDAANSLGAYAGLQYPTRPSHFVLDGVLPNLVATGALQGMVATGASTYDWAGEKSVTIQANDICTSSTSFVINNTSGLTPELKSFMTALGYGDGWRLGATWPFWPVTTRNPSIFATLGDLQAYADPLLRRLGADLWYCRQWTNWVTTSVPSPLGSTHLRYELFNSAGIKRCDYHAFYDATHPAYFIGFDFLIDDHYVAIDKQAWADGLLQKIKAYYGAQ